MLGSLYFSEVAAFVPCELCWYQRILMYPLTVLLTVGLLRSDLDLPYYVLPLSLIGIGVSLYHYLLQKGLVGATGACQDGVPCTLAWINWFSFITIPFLTLVAFLTITVMVVIAWQAELPFREPYAPPPWEPVVGIIALVIVAFTAQTLLGAQTMRTVTAAIGDVAALAPNVELSGEQLYQTSCANCHGTDRQGVTDLGNAIYNTAFVTERDDATLLAFIRVGRAKDAPDNISGLTMPPSGGRPELTDAEMLKIIQYLRTE